MPDRNCSMNFARTHACCAQTREITARFLRAKSRKTASICTRKTARTAVSLPALAWQNLFVPSGERQPVLAKPYRVESRAFSSISRQTACTRTVGIPREIVRLAAFLREDTRSRGFARDSRSRMLSRANAINNFGRVHLKVVCLYSSLDPDLRYISKC